MIGVLDALGVRPGDVVSLVGGGGKSTLALGLARSAADRGDPVVVTTTTKMGADQVPSWTKICSNGAETARVLATGDVAFLVGSISGEKVIGVDPVAVDTIGTTTGATVFVEADGARRRPFKAPDSDEPVIPATTTLVAVVVGIDAVGLPIETGAHRPHRVSALTGRAMDDPIRACDIVTVVNHPDGGRKNVPPACRLALVVTKLDDTTLAALREIEADLDGDITVIGVDHGGHVIGPDHR